MRQLGQTAQRIKSVYAVEELLTEVPVEETLESFQGSCAGGFFRQRVPWVYHPVKTIFVEFQGVAHLLKI